ncbi:DUF2630 family protein [Amycolatopsis sp. K13G38]|uniref:DUF2630 family protein n=1 Tax=Amycolatopsis acididurans TaxID=2724524 RepID=A0ABX1JCD5_9PSEU|nr:DUF2630 family protein [Amycolatopsis acididurans]NKQ56906.1 DUF2630 family protein [Amycolatopsis acididurans]
MSDKDIIGNIDALIAEEHELRTKAVGAGLDESDRDRMRVLETQLDQCWDLLRQRRARREFGEDDADAEVRPASEVESYRQ